MCSHQMESQYFVRKTFFSKCNVSCMYYILPRERDGGNITDDDWNNVCWTEMQLNLFITRRYL